MEVSNKITSAEWTTEFILYNINNDYATRGYDNWQDNF